MYIYIYICIYIIHLFSGGVFFAQVSCPTIGNAQQGNGIGGEGS